MADEQSSLQPSISLESLSYRWLVNPTISSADELSDSFIEMDPRLPPSKRFNPIFLNLNPHDFKFDFPEMEPPLQTLVPADELFSEGLILPLYESSPPRRASDEITSPVKTATRNKCCCSVSKRVLCKYILGFFRPLCRGSSSRVGAKTMSSDHSNDQWSRASCDSESSIHEAVLHCKRSTGARLRVV